MKLRTTKSSEFYSKLQKYIFILPDAEIDPETNLPYDADEYCQVDVDDLICSGCPIDSETGEDMELWAVVVNEDA